MVWAAAKTTKIRQNSDQKLDRKLHRFVYDFLKVFGSFWKAFGSNFGSKSRSKISVVFGSLFFAITERGAAATGLRRDFGRGAYSPDAPQGGTLIARKGYYNDPRNAT